MQRRVLFGTCVLAFGGLTYALAATDKDRRRFKFGVASIQGRREYQEDRFVASDEGVFAVFDGHGGSLVSETASKVFLETLKRTLGGRKGVLDEKVWLETFEKVEEQYRVASSGLADSQGSLRSQGREGSTACAALIDASNLLSVANAGDSRCVVCQKNGKAIAMSVDHKVDGLIDRKRVCSWLFFFSQLMSLSCFACSSMDTRLCGAAFTR